MKITDKEKKLLAFFGIFLIAVVFYKFVFTVQMNKIGKLKAEKQSYQEKINNINYYIDSIYKKQKDIKILKVKISDKTIRLFPEIDEEKVIIDLDKMLSASKINATSLSFSDGNAKAINTVNSNQQDTANTAFPLNSFATQYKSINGIKNDSSSYSPDNNTAQQSNSASCYNMTVNISFTGDYQNIINLLKNIENYNKRLIISSLSIAQTESNKISGSIALNFYGVPKITDEDKSFLKWNIKSVYGKTNPFDDVLGKVSSNTKSSIKNTVKGSSQKYDFFMSSRPINSDLPTIMLGTANDKDRKTYLYGDSKNNLNIFININKQSGKYYCSYSVGNSVYPDGGEQKEFIPAGNSLQMMIYSNPRISKTDTAGANISVNNTTDKKFVINIQYDDNKNPRINVLGQNSKVIVVRK